MNNMRRVLFIVVSLITAFNSCDTSDDRLLLINNSNKNIYYIINYNNLNNVIDSDSPINSEINYIRSGDSTRISTLSRSWKSVFENYGMINIYIFSESAIKNHSWDSIKNQKAFLQHYRLGLEDVEKKNWKIVFK